MTLYLRPMSLEMNQQRAQGDIQSSRAAPEALILSISRKEEDKLTLWYEFDLNQFKVQSQEDPPFVGLPVATSYLFQFKHKNMPTAKKINKSTQMQIDLNQWIENFSGSKRDIFTKTIKMREYKLNFEYKYNKFVQVCAREIKEKETNQQYLGQQMHRDNMKNLEINTASKGKLNIVEERNDLKYHPNIQQIVQSKQQSKIMEIQPNQKTEETLLPKSKIKFYQGECKHKNLFSCLDPSNELRDQRQFTILEQPYLQ